MATSLTEFRNDSDVDIVTLAFLTKLFDSGGYPKVDFGPICASNQIPQMLSTGATSLLNCPDLTSQVRNFQNAGKRSCSVLAGRKLVG